MIRLLPAALLLAGPAIAATPLHSFAGTVAPPSPTCRSNEAVTLAANPSFSHGFQRLDQLPAASEYLTVYRRVGDCSAPVIVRYDIGQRPTPRR